MIVLNGGLFYCLKITIFNDFRQKNNRNKSLPERGWFYTDDDWIKLYLENHLLIHAFKLTGEKIIISKKGGG